MSRPDIEFDHDADCIKHRELGKGVTYEQNGVLFSSGYVALKILRERPAKDKFDDMTPDELRAALRGQKSPVAAKPKKHKVAAPSKPQTPRQSADDKLSGFRNEDNPDYVQQALSENHAAVMAEESAQ
jgi:hypothetical protein